MKQPTDVKVPGPGGMEVTLAWRESDWPGGREVHLDLEGVTEGTADRVWVVHGTAYVADIKKSDWSSPDGVDSLQLHAYALAACEKWDCDSYCLGVWNSTEGEWDWGEIHDIMDFATLDTYARVKAAALNTSGEYATGPHCHNCWSRLYCKEWMVAAGNPIEALAPFTGSTPATPESMAKSLDLVKSIEDLLKVVKATQKAYADREGGIVSEDGTKIWKAGSVKGRASLNKQMLEEESPGIVERCTTRGPESTRYSWRKNK